MSRTDFASRRSLAVVGGGPSGLAMLRWAVERLPDWEIVCFESQDDIRGSWGTTYPGFTSTSTKFLTQFASFPKFEAVVSADRARREEFFRDDEYGAYLREFAEHFGLAKFLRLGTSVVRLDPPEKGTGGPWRVTTKARLGGELETRSFTHVVLCTGLAARLRPVEGETPSLRRLEDVDQVAGKTVVVAGGGESGADLAQRLSRPELGNRVFLSLRSGIRVSPRYHPIRDVPSDFLRNRLMLSIDERLRNAVGEAFVRFRIRRAAWLRARFPPRIASAGKAADVDARRADWNRRLNERAEGRLFNMFHNKSDDFLTSLAEGRIDVIGPAVEGCSGEFWDFDQTNKLTVDPDLVVGAIGYESGLAAFASAGIRLSDFYRGCMHRSYENLFCVGHARPIIGAIPPIAELQARYVTALLNGELSRPADLEDRWRREQASLRRRYPTISGAVVHPVDMFPYCDELAKELGVYSSPVRRRSVRDRLSFWLSPAATTQYPGLGVETPRRQRVYMPATLIGLLLLVKLFDVPYRGWRRVFGE